MQCATEEPRYARRPAMRASTFAPSAPLAPFVRSITILEADDETLRTVLPDPGILLAIRWCGSASEVGDDVRQRLPDAAITGIRRSVRRIYTAAGGGVVVVAFREAGAPAFFAEPLHEIFGETVGLDGLVAPMEIDRVSNELASAVDHRRRVAIVERFLLSRPRSPAPDALVAAAVDAIRTSHGAVRIGALADRLAISRDRFEKRFRRAVGTSPKMLASIHRLHRAVELFHGGMGLTRLAIEAGYFDQSHLVRDFRSFTGRAPRAFLSGDACMLSQRVRPPIPA